MSEHQSTEVQRQQVGAHWSQLVFATILNIVLPGSGASYLGFPSLHKRTVWQEYESSLGLLVLVPLVLSQVNDFELSNIAFWLSLWLLIGISFSVQTWRKALTAPSAVKVQPIQSNTWLMLISIFCLSLLCLWQSRLDELTFFRAPNSSTGTAAGDLFYGFSYAPDEIRLHRGQLIFANVDGENALVRVLAVPGDIFALGENTIYLNGFTTPQHIPAKAGWSGVRKMREILAGIEAPGDRSQPANLTGNVIALDGAAPGKAEILGPASFVVARDTDLLRDSPEALVVYSIGPRHIVSVPWARVWSWGDHPGARSDLAQPAISFLD